MQNLYRSMESLRNRFLLMPLSIRFLSFPSVSETSRKGGSSPL